MLIKNEYIGSFNEIRERYGEATASYVIEENATLKEAIGYTGQYVVGDETHFRYNRYTNVLDKAVRKFDCIHPKRKIVHLDLGCGPSLFAWVVHDYLMMRRRKADLKFYVYDHAESMIKLAKMFWNDFSCDTSITAYHDIRALRNRLRSVDLSGCDVLVTFGHVLIQVRSDDKALYEFYRTIRNLFPSGSCTMIAVDAYSNRCWQDTFRDSCNDLSFRLRRFGLGVEMEFGSERSYMYARLTGRK